MIKIHAFFMIMLSLPVVRMSVLETAEFTEFPNFPDDSALSVASHFYGSASANGFTSLST
jgi:hypothetical protein